MGFEKHTLLVIIKRNRGICMVTIRKIKIEDSDELRVTLDDIYENTSQIVVAKWALKLTRHIFEIAGYHVDDYAAVITGFLVNEAWQKGQARKHDVRQAGFKIHELARKSEDIVLKTAARVAGQAVGTGHMKEHAMVASDYVIKIVNMKYPGDRDMVIQERLWQIKALEMQIQEGEKGLESKQMRF